MAAKLKKIQKTGGTARQLDNLICIHVNADTLTNKLVEFEFIVNKENPDIIGVSEILPKNLKRQIFPEEFNIKGYNMVYHKNIADNIGRGTIVYIKENLNYKEINIKPIKGTFEEGLFIEITVSNSEKLLCALIYRRGESDDEINENLLEIISMISNNQNYDHSVIMGDFNLRDINWENLTSQSIDPENYNNKFIECVRDCFLTQHVLEPTRQRGRDNPSCLDLVFSNKEELIEDIDYLAPLGKSDHSVIKFKIKLETEPPPPKISVKFEKGDYEKIRETMASVDWQNEFEKYPNDVEKQWHFFREKLQEAEEKYIPRKNVFINGKKNKKFSIPLDRENLKKIKKKNKLWGKIRKNLAYEEEKLQYNRLRNQIRRLTLKSKKLIEKTVAKNSKSNPKAFWKYAQSKMKQNKSVPDLINNEDKKNPTYTTSDKDKADVFLDYFSSVFTTEPNEDNMPFFARRDFERELDEIEISEKIVLEKLLKLKVNKSPGPDNVHPRVLREIASSIKTPLAILFKTSINTKTLPKDWKHANVSAIHKKGNRSAPQNYRPVSLTSIICKTLEGIIRDAIIKHMNHNILFSAKQFGFLSGRSTVLQMLKVLDIWSQILDQGGCLDVIYCDFMKAFDKVPHNRLLYKLGNYGITGNTLGWINSFLIGRTQKVKINEAMSESAPVTSGIPQGSVLGPILFVIYINDLPDVVDKDSHVYLFADDTKVFRQIKSDNDRIILQKDIDNLLVWSSLWLLKFHPDKCVFMGVGYTEDNENTYYNMNGHSLATTQCEKDLGVYFDNALKFDHHINTIINRANRMLGIVRRTFSYLNKETFCQLYKGLIRPHLEYAVPVWSPHLVKHKNALEKVQERATKLVPGLSSNYNTRLEELKLPTLAYRRVRGDMINVFKILDKGFDKSVTDMLPINTSDMRGHDRKLRIDRHQKDIRKYNFSMRVRKIWNSLPESAIKAGDVIEFEKELDDHWKNQDVLYKNHKAEIKLPLPLRFMD